MRSQAAVIAMNIITNLLLCFSKIPVTSSWNPFGLRLLKKRSIGLYPNNFPCDSYFVLSDTAKLADGIFGSYNDIPGRYGTSRF